MMHDRTEDQNRNKPFVSVVIPAHNEQDYLRRCLESLRNQDYGEANYEVIVVDNNSTDGTANIVRLFPEVQYYFKQNGPVGAVRNFGASKAKGQYLAFLDADCIAPRDWIRNGSAHLKRNELGAAGGKYEADEGANWLERFWLLGNKQESSTSLDLIGGTIFVTKDHFNLVNGFNKTITSGEDTKLADDLRKAGFTVEVNQALNVVHLGNAKTVGEFIRRQAWHSENYLMDIRVSLKDPTFILVTGFLFLLSVSASLLVLGEPEITAQLVVAALAIPNILTIKRISRSKSARHNIRHYHQVYALDLLYLVGRTIGVLRGLRRMVRQQQAASR